MNQAHATAPELLSVLLPKDGKIYSVADANGVKYAVVCRPDAADPVLALACLEILDARAAKS